MLCEISRSEKDKDHTISNSIKKKKKERKMLTSNMILYNWYFISVNFLWHSKREMGIWRDQEYLLMVSSIHSLYLHIAVKTTGFRDGVEGPRDTRPRRAPLHTSGPPESPWAGERADSFWLQSNQNRLLLHPMLIGSWFCQTTVFHPDQWEECIISVDQWESRNECEPQPRRPITGWERGFPEVSASSIFHFQ